MVEKITSVMNTLLALHSLDLFWTSENRAQEFSQAAFDISIKTKFFFSAGNTTKTPLQILKHQAA